MILQALYTSYPRFFKQNKAPEFGFSLENVGFALEIDLKGNLIQDHDLRQGEGKDARPVLLEIPFTNEVNVRANNIQANFLADKAAYLIGNDKKTKKDRLEKCHNQFKNLILDVTEGISDDGLTAIRNFYKKWDPKQAPNLSKYWEDISSGSSGFLVFRLSGERDYIHNHKSLRQAWVKYLKSHGTAIYGNCLLTGGENEEIQRVHAQFKGIAGGQSSGKSLVSFNMKSVESYGKEQSYNSPISIQAEFECSTVLKYLIRSDAHHLYVADAFTVFWTERDSPVEGSFGMMLDPDDNAADDRELGVFLESIRQGKFPEKYDPDIRFYTLGLSPNAARLSVRFWYANTVKDISEKIGWHFRDLAMVRSFDTDPEYPGIRRLLYETTNRKSKDGPPPLLAGAVMQSILNGTPYPQALLSAVIGRIRAEQSAKDKNGRQIPNVNYMRAAIIKAVLTRKNRIFGHGMEVPMALDKHFKEAAYLLGRLFAACERIQEDAHRDESGRSKLNSTIRDRYYSSASAAPQMVFPILLKLKNHNLGKIDNQGLVVNHEKLIGEIMDAIDPKNNFPKTLNLENQGLFHIGYYHQRQDFYTKKNNTKEEGDKQ
jgi:CRISPR-associated protein Csd1